MTTILDDESLITLIRSFIYKHNEIHLGVILDYRWSQRRNALNGTLTIRTFSNFLLGRVHILRTVSDAGTTERRTFVGAAKNMEGASIRLFLERLQQSNASKSDNDYSIVIAAFVHDQDSCATKLIHEHFPDAREFLDIGHAAKNLKKRAAKVARGYGEKACNAFLKCMRSFSNTTDRAHALRAYPFHLSGNHRYCIGSCPHAKFKTASEALEQLSPTEKERLIVATDNEDTQTEDETDDDVAENTQIYDDSSSSTKKQRVTQSQGCTAALTVTATTTTLTSSLSSQPSASISTAVTAPTIVISEEEENKEMSDARVETTSASTTQETINDGKMTTEQLHALQKLFNEYAARTRKYMHGLNTQKIESGNSVMTILTNKRKFFRNTYEGRVDASLIRMEYGDRGLGLIMRVAGNNVTNHTMAQLQTMDKAKHRDKIRKKSPNVKRKRREDKMRKQQYAKKKKIVYPDLTYKGTSDSVIKQRCCSVCKKPGHNKRTCPHSTR